MDDDEDMRHIVSDTLERMGYGVLAVASGPEALRAMASQSFRLAVVDLETANSRQKAAIEMRRCDPEMPVIVLTDTPDWRIEEVRQMAQGWLHKPFRLEQLRRLVERVLREGSQEET